MNKIPHRAYRDGFLFNKLSEFPEWEDVIASKAKQSNYGSPRSTLDDKPVISTTLDSAGPLFNRNYFWTFTNNFIEKNKKKYFEINPKEVIEPGMKMKYLSPDAMGELIIIDIINEQWKQLEKAHCNTGNVYVLTDKKLQGWELLYE